MSRWLRAFRQVAAGLVVGLAALLAGTSTVSACTGTRLGDPGPEIGPAMAFTGTVVRRDEPFTLGVQSSLDPIAWTFVVDAVRSGPDASRITIHSPRMDASCGIQFELGQRYAVRAEWREDGTLGAIQGEATLIEPVAQPPRVEGSFTASFEWAPVGVGGALVLVLLVAFVAFVARRRTTSDPTDSAT